MFEVWFRFCVATGACLFVAERLSCACVKACSYITKGSNAFECMIHGTKLCVCVCYIRELNVIV